MLLQSPADLAKESEYLNRASRTREELQHELEPMDFYAQSYRRILRGKPVE